jgi:hypothetical protein
MRYGPSVNPYPISRNVLVQPPVKIRLTYVIIGCSPAPGQLKWPAQKRISGLPTGRFRTPKEIGF